MSAVNRTPRTTRESGSRSKVWKPPAKLEVPPPPQGYKYRWVRHELIGQDQTSNVYERTRQGYEPVTPDELAGFDVESLDSGKHAGTVRSGDLILMKVPEDIADQRTSYYTEKTLQMQRAVDQELDSNRHSAMPITKERQSTTSMGSPVKMSD